MAKRGKNAPASSVVEPQPGANEGREPAQTATSGRLPRVQLDGCATNIGVSSRGTPRMPHEAHLKHCKAKLRALRSESQSVPEYLISQAKQLVYRLGYLLGGYLFDWHESLIIYTMYAALLGLVVYGLAKQIMAGAAVIFDWQDSS